MAVIFSDDFSIVYADHSWGPNWPNPSYYSRYDTGYSVDGSVGRVNWSSYIYGYLPDSRRMQSGTISFDFRTVGVSIPNEGFNPYIEFDNGAGYPYWFQIRANWQTFELSAAMYQYGQGQWGTIYLSTQVLSDGQWYTCKAYSSGVAGGDFWLKIWPKGDPEPTVVDNQKYDLGTIDPASSENPPEGWWTPFWEFDAPGWVPPDTDPHLEIDNVLFEGQAPDHWSYSKYLFGNAALLRNQIGSFAADATIYPRRFTSDAWIVGGRTRHNRLYDHFGTEPDNVIAIVGPIGQFPTGTDVHTVLLDFAVRIAALEAGNHRVRSFLADAFILPSFRADAVLRKTGIVGKPYFPFFDQVGIWADAYFTLVPIKHFTADARIIGRPVGSFTANALFIDLVC